ncbi:transcriptional attenuator, LytR family [Saccharopolyspora kobensis]|uniref:Transcriptional attenuator, LytR family n=1 Tax=Saccharopolyspora kobensis TaxID=146035 RepID=A0A1H6ENH5_9PSEU|nr:LCP family protein [Saccharopolyspora kobensis]SEG98566.1 transcriptional attenuator, LytR family [Saccharopolyspora kobensis]SFF28498.1 transcriptional attenuator, LytR family [Saccharopolyspora kobensis]
MGGPEQETEAVEPAQRRAGFRIAGRSALALFSAVVLGITAIGWIVVDQLSDVSSAKVLADAPPTPNDDDGATDVLLVGSDSRTDAQGNPLPDSVLKQLRTEAIGGLNTDSLVVIRVPHSNAPTTAVSIPRDTYAQVPGGRPEKINAVYGLTKSTAAEQLRSQGRPEFEVEREAQLAGQRALVQTVQNLTGLRIDHYAEINLLGFYELTEAVGGVEVCLQQDTSDKDSGAEFTAGRHIISGGDALSFVRQRHGLPRGDLDRIVRQQVFMAALANKVLSTGTLTDPAMVNDLVQATRRAVVLDEGWEPLGFVEQMQEIAAGRVTFLTLPVTETNARDDRGQSIVNVDPAAAQRFFAGLTSAPPGLTAKPNLQLDGTARTDRQITSDGSIPCVH